MSFLVITSTIDESINSFKRRDKFFYVSDIFLRILSDIQVVID